MIKLKSLGSIVAAAIAIGTAALPQPSQAQTPRRTFFCGMSQGRPATVVRTVRGPMTMVIWINEDFTASGWTPERRCKEISGRFERFNSSGQLKHLKAGKVSGQPVICAASTRSSSCSSNTVLITLPAGTNANAVLDRLLNTRAGASATPIYLSPDNDKAVRLTYDQNGDASVDVDAIVDQINW
ncbi:COP23 domain-containing protein [Phormidium nigroviride]